MAIGCTKYAYFGEASLRGAHRTTDMSRIPRGLKKQIPCGKGERLIMEKSSTADGIEHIRVIKVTGPEGNETIVDIYDAADTGKLNGGKASGKYVICCANIYSSSSGQPVLRHIDPKSPEYLAMTKEFTKEYSNCKKALDMARTEIERNYYASVKGQILAKQSTLDKVAIVNGKAEYIDVKVVGHDANGKPIYETIDGRPCEVRYILSGEKFTGHAVTHSWQVVLKTFSQMQSRKEMQNAFEKVYGTDYSKKEEMQWQEYTANVANDDAAKKNLKQEEFNPVTYGLSDRTTAVAAAWHDRGMVGDGVTTTKNSTLACNPKKPDLRVVVVEGTGAPREIISDNSENPLAFDDVRLNHAAVSCQQILINREQIKENCRLNDYEIEAAAASAFFHSKSCSGVVNLNSRVEMINAFNEIRNECAELQKLGFDAHFDLGSGIATSDKDYLNKLDENLKQAMSDIAGLSISLRIGDGSRTSGNGDSTQSGKHTFVEEGETPPLEKVRSELASNVISRYGSGGDNESIEFTPTDEDIRKYAGYSAVAERLEKSASVRETMIDTEGQKEITAESSSRGPHLGEQLLRSGNVSYDRVNNCIVTNYYVADSSEMRQCSAMKSMQDRIDEMRTCPSVTDSVKIHVPEKYAGIWNEMFRNQLNAHDPDTLAHNPDAGKYGSIYIEIVSD